MAQKYALQPQRENDVNHGENNLRSSRCSRIVFALLSTVVAFASSPSTANSQEPEDDRNTTTSSANPQDTDSSGEAPTDGSTDEVSDSGGKGIQFNAPRSLDMQFGMRFQANDNYCTEMLATIAFPTDWPEQKVKLKLLVR